MKARRPEDPRQFVLTEELHLFNFEPKNRHCAPRVERRVLPSDENMFQAQSLWRSSAGKFILTERAQAQIEVFAHAYHIKNQNSTSINPA